LIGVWCRQLIEDRQNGKERDKELKLGLQLYSVRDNAEKDLPGVLGAIAQMGYQGVEFAGFLGHDLGALRRHLDLLGLAAIGTHTRLADIDQDIERVIEDHHILGAAYCTVPYHKAEAADDWRKFAQKLNVFGRQFKDTGIVLSYHNHHFEFEPIEGTTPYAILREVCDPTLVGMELDVAWARKAGQDPAALLVSLGAQCPLLHLKDVSQDGTDVNIGAGLVDMPAVLKAAGQAGVVWGIVERDSAPPPTLESARVNWEVLRALGYRPE
jgi:sugar phosphate isomerase/epimerase